MTHIDVRAEKLSATPAEKETWRELLQNLASAQRQMSDPEKSVTEYFGVEVNGSRCVPSNQNLSDCLFRKSLKAFRALYACSYPTKQTAESCNLLISMVGFSLEPIMHTILTLRPKKVVFVFSKESARFRPRVKTLDYLKSLIVYHGKDYDPKIEEIILKNTDTALVFSTVNNAIAQSSFSGGIAIDVTGGKKSMDASAFLAASLQEDVSIYYVDYEAYNSDEGYPIWGSEFLNRQANPYAFFSIREEHLIMGLWETGNFSAVKELVASVIESAFTREEAEQYSLAERYDKLVEIEMAAACYEAWSRFDYIEASKNNFESRSFFHEQVLDELVRCPDVFVNNKVCQRSDSILVLKLAIDRYVRGCDAARHGEWNRAALCYTQAVEAILDFTYSAERNEVLKRDTTALVRLNNLFNGHDKKRHESFFRGEILRKKINEDVLNQRNLLSHYTCTNQHAGSIADNDLQIDEVMRKMDVAVHDFLLLFADRYKINKTEVDTFFKQINFLKLDKNLCFIA